MPKSKRQRMTKADLVERAATTIGITKKDTAAVVDAFIQAISDALTEGYNVEIRRFGCFKLKERKSRKARNPRTGHQVLVESRIVPIFQISKEIKNRIAKSAINFNK